MVQDTLSLDEYHAMQGTGKRNKHNAKRVFLDGRWFASGDEATRYQELRILEQAGEIANLELQPRYILQPAFTYRGERVQAITYKPDFRYLRVSDGMIVIEDVKGHATRDYQMRRKMLLAQWAANGDSFEFIEVHMRERKPRKGKRGKKGRK